MDLSHSPELLRDRARIWFDTFAELGSVDSARLATLGYCFGGQVRAGDRAGSADVKATVALPWPADPHAPARSRCDQGADPPLTARAAILAFRSRTSQAFAPRLTRGAGLVPDHRVFRRAARVHRSEASAYARGGHRVRSARRRRFFMGRHGRLAGAGAGLGSTGTARLLIPTSNSRLRQMIHLIHVLRGTVPAKRHEGGRCIRADDAK